MAKINIEALGGATKLWADLKFELTQSNYLEALYTILFSSRRRRLPSP